MKSEGVWTAFHFSTHHSSYEWTWKWPLKRIPINRVQRGCVWANLASSLQGLHVADWQPRVLTCAVWGDFVVRSHQNWIFSPFFLVSPPVYLLDKHNPDYQDILSNGEKGRVTCSSLTWSRCLCLLFFLLIVCLFKLGTISGDGGRSELGRGCSAGASRSFSAQGAGSSLFATSASSWQTAVKES